MTRIPEWTPGKTLSIGIDEVGWGSGAGPLMIAVVALLYPVEGLKDSKQLSASRREKLYNQILDSSIAVHIAERSVQFINTNKLAESWQSAAAECVDWVRENIGEDLIVVDGSTAIRGADSNKYRLIPQADNIVPGVMAASVVAKVTRDRMMIEESKNYPGYDFHKNMGYFTAPHIESIRKLGLSSYHRYTAYQFSVSSAPPSLSLL